MKLRPGINLKLARRLLLAVVLVLWVQCVACLWWRVEARFGAWYAGFTWGAFTYGRYSSPDAHAEFHGLRIERQSGDAGGGADVSGAGWWFKSISVEWLILGLPFALTALAAPDLVTLARRFRPHRHGHCTNCRYDLAGNTTGICPECGTPCSAAR